jgi:hypothetical protein
MAIFHDTRWRRPRSFDESLRSTDSALNILIVALLIGFGLATWYFYAGPTVDQTNTGKSTITEPVTTPSAPNASPTHPAPSPNPGP